MKWIGLGVGILLVLTFLYLLLIKGENEVLSPGQVSDKKRTEEKDKKTAPFDAYFVIYTNGTLRNFDNPMYHNLNEDVFIPQDNTGSVRVLRDNITWLNFFNTLPFSLDEECLITGTGQTFCSGEGGSLIFVLNGEEDNSALSREIRKGDKLLISFGSDPARLVQELQIFSQ